jgi:hypothetical protein
MFMALPRPARTIGLVVASLVTLECGRPVINHRPATPDTTPRAPLTQLWNEPRDLEQRDLRWGSAQPDQAPSPDVEYKVVKLDRSGYSNGYDVVGPDGREWDIKVGKEAQTEIVVSRILWALGYHQPGAYYLTGWKLQGTYEDEGEPARFRLQSDHDSDGEWAWLENPFSNTRPFRGLIAINLLLSNWDFKTSNNRIYVVKGPDGPVRRYVVQDLGASFGKPRLARSNRLLSLLPWKSGTRNDIDDFEATKLIREIRGSEATLDYRGPRGEIIETMSVADVIWACELMNRLQDAQLDDAFEAAEYDQAIRARYVAKIRDKLREGLALRADARFSTTGGQP